MLYSLVANKTHNTVREGVHVCVCSVCVCPFAFIQIAHVMRNARAAMFPFASTQRFSALFSLRGGVQWKGEGNNDPKFL